MLLSTASCGDSETTPQLSQTDTSTSVANQESATADTEASIPSQTDSSETEDSSGFEESEETSIPDETDETENTDITVSEDVFTLFENGEYKCPIVRADSATELEIEFYNNFRGKLKEITGVSVKYTSDFIPYNDDLSSRKGPAILIGKTNYDESKQIYENLSYGEGAIKLIGNKIVIAFSDKNTADKIFNNFLNLLRSETKEKIEFSATSLDIFNKASSVISSFPTLKGTTANYVDSGDNTHMLEIPNVTLEDFNAYKQLLANEGYECINEREANKNYFATYVKNKTYMYTYFQTYSKSIRVILGSVNNLPDYEAEKTVTTKVREPALTLFNQLASSLGLGMIYHLPDGRFVIFDGGDNYRIDTLYPFLKSHSVDGNITIAAWFLSHAHNDHQGMFMKLVNNHSDVKIENLIHNYAARESYLDIGEDNNTLMQALRNLIRKKLPDTKIIKAHTGQVFSFGGCEFEIIYTQEDIAPKKFEMFNDTSLIVRAKFEGKTILMLADATHRVGTLLINNYGDYLKSDMVQIAHHGIWGTNYKVYDYVKAEVVFWPSNAISVQEWITDRPNVTALNYASDIYISGFDDVTIKFPYTVINNKEEFLATHPPISTETETDTDADTNTDTTISTESTASETTEVTSEPTATDTNIE